MARILAILSGAVGDFILTLPAIRLLAEGLPDAEVEVLGYPGIADLAVTAGVAARARNLEHRRMAPLFVPRAVVDEETAAYFRSFDLVVSYLYDGDGYFRENLERLGVRTLIECPHRVQPDGGPASVQLARPLERLALFLEQAAPQLHPAVEQVDEANEPVQRRLWLHPGSGSEKKTWPLERWAEVVDALRERRPEWQWRLITGEAERDRGILDGLSTPAWRQRVTGQVHGVPLPELARQLRAEALSGRAVFVGHDSGISHLAAAVGLPALLLFGPTDPAVWSPLNDGVRTLRGARGEAIDELAVEEVISGLEAFLDPREEHF